MMRAAFYGRYSSHAQKDTSIEQQLRECREWAQRNDIQIVAEYSDRALTGTTDRREQFQKMIRDSAKGRWQLVLCYKVDRFARNRYDSATYKAKLKKNGVRVVYAKESIPEGPEGILLESVLEGSAEYYSANLSQNIMRGMRENALECKVNNGAMPIGLMKGTDGRYTIEPAGATVVRDIFEMYAGGANVITIINALNARGLKTSTGSRWNKNSLHRILRNEKYIGIYRWGDVRVEGGIPAILSKELFNEVQDRMKKVARAPGASRTEVDYILTGKLFCGHCGSPMIGESGTSRSGKKYYYYSCGERKHRRACKKKPVKKDWIEETLVRLLRDRCLTDDVIRVIVDAAMDLQEREKDDSVLRGFETELAEVKRAIANLIAAIEQGIISPSTKQRLDELEARRVDLEVAIEDEKIQQPQLTRDQLTFWLERFRDGDPSDPKFRETFIEVFVSKVYLYDDHFRAVCNFTGDQDGINYDFVNDLESWGDAGEVFDFEAPSSTKHKALNKKGSRIFGFLFCYIKLRKNSGFLFFEIRFINSANRDRKSVV